MVCRYWLLSTYEERHARHEEPENIDKEFLRLWFRDNCDPYNDEVTHKAAGIVFEGCFKGAVRACVFNHVLCIGDQIDCVHLLK